MNGISLHTQHLNAWVPPVLQHAALSVPLVRAATDPTLCAGTAHSHAALSATHPACLHLGEAGNMHAQPCLLQALHDISACMCIAVMLQAPRMPHAMLQLQHATGGHHLNNIQQLTMLLPTSFWFSTHCMRICRKAATWHSPSGQDCCHDPQFCDQLWLLMCNAARCSYSARCMLGACHVYMTAPAWPVSHSQAQLVRELPTIRIHTRLGIPLVLHLYSTCIPLAFHEYCICIPRVFYLYSTCIP